MEGHYRLFFCHQSIQEMLTALCIIEKDLEEFQQFVCNKLHQSKWSVVRRFVCGVLLNEGAYNDAKGDLIIGQFKLKDLRYNTPQYNYEETEAIAYLARLHVSYQGYRDPPRGPLPLCSR